MSSSAYSLAQSWMYSQSWPTPTAAIVSDKGTI